jgi:hypothetical protein
MGNFVLAVLLLVSVWFLWELSRRAKIEQTLLLRGIGIGFAKFLRAYLIVLVVGGVLSLFESHFPIPGLDTAGSLGRLTGETIGVSIVPTVIGLLVELGMTRKFTGRIFLYVSLTVLLLPTLTSWYAAHVHSS